MKYIVKIIESFLVSLSIFIRYFLSEIDILPPEVQKLESRKIHISITLSNIKPRTSQTRNKQSTCHYTAEDGYFNSIFESEMPSKPIDMMFGSIYYGFWRTDFRIRIILTGKSFRKNSQEFLLDYKSFQTISLYTFWYPHKSTATQMIPLNYFALKVLITKNPNTWDLINSITAIKIRYKDTFLFLSNDLIYLFSYWHISSYLRYTVSKL